MDIAKAAVVEREAPAPRPLELPSPFLLFLGDTVEPGYVKTAFGLRDWTPDRCIEELRLPGASVTTELPQMGPAEARHGRADQARDG